jgi:hypothetical protein
MTQSKAFSDYSNRYPVVLQSDFEHHFGPNYETLFNYWSFLDTLSSSEIAGLYSIYHADYESYKYSYVSSSLENYASNIIPQQYVVWDCSRLGTFYSHLGYAALEIVAMHKLLDEGKKLKVITLFDKL